MNQKKTTALLLGLTMSLTGTTFAAPTDQAQDIDSRIAALEQQQSNLEKEIKELRHQNSQLKNQTHSQEKQLNGLSKSVKSELDRVQISGFGRVSWDNDNIKGYTDRNDNRRFYLDLKGKFKVNDDWNFNFESETNPRYANYVMADGSNPTMATTMKTAPSSASGSKARRASSTTTSAADGAASASRISCSATRRTVLSSARPSRNRNSRPMPSTSRRRTKAMTSASTVLASRARSATACRSVRRLPS